MSGKEIWSLKLHLLAVCKHADLLVNVLGSAEGKEKKTRAGRQF